MLGAAARQNGVSNRLFYSEEARRKAREAFVAPALNEPQAERRYLLGALLCLLAALFTGAVAQLSLSRLGYDPLAPEMRLALTLLSLAAPLLLLRRLTPLVHHRPFSTLFGAAGALQTKALLAGAGGAVAAALAMIGFGFAIGALEMRAAPGIEAVLFFGLLITAQAAAEEIFFRGYMLHAFAPLSGVGPIVWAAPSILLFVLLHYTPDGGWRALLWPLAFGAGASYLVWRTGGLSAALGFHVAHNWIALLLLGEDGPTPGLGPLRWADEASRASVSALGFAALIAAIAALARSLPAERPAND